MLKEIKVLSTMFYLFLLICHEKNDLKPDMTHFLACPICDKTKKSRSGSVNQRIYCVWPNWTLTEPNCLFLFIFFFFFLICSIMNKLCVFFFKFLYCSGHD